jgi:RNA polymerase sigma-70 factor (ECF subfamily)
MPNNVPSHSTSGLDLPGRIAEQLAVERVRQGDAFALEMIFTAYRAELLAAAERISGTREVAEEVVQDVFLAIWRGRARWRIETSLGAYLRRAVHNVAARSKTSRTRGGATGLELERAELLVPTAFADRSPTPDVDVERGELAAAIDEAIRGLPPRAREAFTLRRLHHFSNREIAARLGLSVKTVEIHLSRARAALRRRLAAWRG